MNSRGQAALEYLMTYGWALIVIAIVVGVLVFIVATPTGAVACNSSQPGKLNVVSNNIDASTGAGSMVVTNLVGGSMTSTYLFTTGVFVSDTNSSITIDGTTITGGNVGNMTIGDHTITVGAAGANPDSTTTGSHIITYNDPAGLSQTATITCQNLDVS